ncbi:MAG: murein biosynthesis integral membrane protein MurJ [Elusimicrobiota bacterium]
MDKDRISHAAVIVTTAAIISKILGYIREMVIAGQFGASAETDAYFAALAAPEFVISVIAGGALTSAFIPVFSDYLSKNEYKKAGKVYSTIFNSIALLMLTLLIISIVFSSEVLHIIAPGLPPDTFTTATKLAYIVFPSMVFMGLASYMGGVINATKHFLMPALKKSVLNISVIVGAVLLSNKLGIYGLAFGFLAGAVMQFLMLLFAVNRKKFQYRFSINLTHPAIRKIGKLWIPLVVTLIFGSANNIIVKNLASVLSEGSISALHFAYRLKQLPVVIFGVTLSTVIFPFISWDNARNKMGKFRNSVTKALQMVFFITFPLCLGLALYRMPVIRVLFERGSFTAQSSTETAIALLGYLPGAIAVSMNYILIRSFHALKDMITPLIATIISFGVIIVSGIYLREVFAPGGISLANSFAEIVYFSILFFKLGIFKDLIDIKKIWGSGIKVITISLVTIIPVWYLIKQFNILTEPILIVITVPIVCSVIYIGLAKLLNMDEINLLFNLVKEKVNG